MGDEDCPTTTENKKVSLRMKPKVEKKRCKSTKVKRIANFSECQTNIGSTLIPVDPPANKEESQTNIGSTIILVDPPANEESSSHPDMTELGQEYNKLIDFIGAGKKALQNFRDNRMINHDELNTELFLSSNELKNLKKKIPWSDRILTKIVTKRRKICAPITKFTQSCVEWSPLNSTFLWITFSFFLIFSGHQQLMKQREIIHKQVWLERYANILKSEKDDLDAERDELRSEINFEKSNEKDNSIQGSPQQEENLESITNDGDSYKDDLYAEGNELESEKEFEKPNENDNYKPNKEFSSPIVNVNSTRSKNMDSDEERDAESVKESSNSKNEETKVESGGLHPFNRKKGLMIAGVGLVGVFAIAIFLAIYRYKNNQHKDQIIQDKMKFDHSFHIQPVLFDGDDEHYDMV